MQKILVTSGILGAIALVLIGPGFFIALARPLLFLGFGVIMVLIFLELTKTEENDVPGDSD